MATETEEKLVTETRVKMATETEEKVVTENQWTVITETHVKTATEMQRKVVTENQWTVVTETQGRGQGNEHVSGPEEATLNLFVVYLVTLPVTQTTQSRVTG
jgi:hypothetical protein